MLFRSVVVVSSMTGAAGVTEVSVVVSTVVVSVVVGSSSTADATEPIMSTDATAIEIAPNLVQMLPTDARMGVDVSGRDVAIVTRLQTTTV